MRLFALVGTLLVLAAGAPAYSAVEPSPEPGGQNCPAQAPGESDDAYLARIRDSHCVCPAKRKGETQTEYLIRTRPVCEIKWREKVQAGTTGKETHEHFLERCGRACAAGAWADKTALGLAGLGLLGVGIGVAASSGGNDKPASP